MSDNGGSSPEMYRARRWVSFSLSQCAATTLPPLLLVVGGAGFGLGGRGGQVPGASMRIGEAFEALEAARGELGLSDYAVAQPTLEQVRRS